MKDITTPKNVSLADLTKEYQWIEYQLLANDGEITPEIESYMLEVQQKVLQKSDTYVYVMNRLEATSEFFKGESTKYLKASKRALAVRERMKDTMKAAMLTMGATQIEGTNSKLTLSNSTPKLIIENESQLDSKFIDYMITVERTTLKKIMLEAYLHILPKVNMDLYHDFADFILGELEQYMNPEIKTEDIKQALKNGEHVQGAKLQDVYSLRTTINSKS